MSIIHSWEFISNKKISANKRVIFNLPKHNIAGIPDGMTIDKRGNLWVAVYDGHQVSILHI